MKKLQAQYFFNYKYTFYNDLNKWGDEHCDLFGTKTSICSVNRNSPTISIQCDSLKKKYK
jgi:hypothetical protein